MSAIKNFLITFCISVLLFGLIAYLIVSYALNNNLIPVFSEDDITNNPSDIDNPNNNPNTSDLNQTGEPSEAPVEAIVDVNTVTFLLIGTDYQPEVFNDYDLSEYNSKITGFPRKERNINADSIVMIHINNELKQFMLSAIPANMSLLVDGVRTTLGSLYSSKGIEYFCGKVTAVTSLKIDYYAVIALNDFAKIIDNINGISFNVPTDMVYEDPDQDLKINLPKGQQQLNGDKAVKMLRYRSYSDGDISRMGIAIEFAKNLLAKITGVDYITRLPSTYSLFMESVETNFTENDLTATIESLLSYSVFEKEVIKYPGTFAGDTFEPNINDAINTYKQYK